MVPRGQGLSERQKTEDRRQKTEDRRQKTEERRMKNEAVTRPVPRSQAPPQAPPLPRTTLSNQYSTMKHGSTYLHICEANALHSVPALDNSLAILVDLGANNRYWPVACSLPHYAIRATQFPERIQECGIGSYAFLLY